VPFAIVEKPPVFVARRIGFAMPEEMAHMLARALHVLAVSETQAALVYDAGDDAAGRPDARSRRLTADWMAEHEALLRTRCAGVDFAFPTALSRGVLTAIFWLKAPPFPVSVHTSCRAALESAARRVQADTNVEALLEELRGQSRKTG